MEFNGLPLHALVVHAAVVFGPLAALAGLLYALVPRWRDRLRWPLVATAAIALGAIWVAYLSGEELTEANTYGGPLAALVETHEERAGILRISMTAFAVLSFLAAWWHTRTGPVRLVMGGLVAASAVVTLVYVVLTGDAGAQVAWYGVEG
ncbi:hypothetical protein NSZ01_23230 [Nocardioides szechwanensis]|uniref:DUF2231 domain-containing protein n=1 Tax=Nocardioides szechwanensis TaxID=1005944 RepID=A0A1H0IMJ8_9ACTN|nr:DUF2231 domain-containing protein [Nocardioides szechwanensis]GEP34555.1 hypothetical protein NSZ01_23230 [Nocardioides szechwanensis]SDO32530.1 hypothetical protein SAMN05192576_3847 [Nocardioides szechwanensis]